MASMVNVNVRVWLVLPLPPLPPLPLISLSSPSPPYSPPSQPSLHLPPTVPPPTVPPSSSHRPSAHSRSHIQRAIDTIKRAIDADEAHRYEDACALYDEGIRYLMAAVKGECIRGKACTDQRPASLINDLPH
ncbi:hypothetical protein K523DRAFT_319577 [Schizophyllum commune Tattone D]|nr:hypothetical protein K523DRAFT_319577 [Schizophyllum commune Tattone D]